MPQRPNSCCYEFFQVIQTPLCVCRHGLVDWINQAGLKLLQAPNQDTVIGSPLVAYVSDDYAELFDNGLALLADEEESIPLVFMTVTGTPLDVKIKVTNIAEGAEGEWHFVEIQNISDLIEAARETRDREQRMHAILSAVDQAVISIDQFGSIKTVNDVTTKMFGYEKRELIGNNINMLMPEPHHSNHDDYLLRYQSTGHAKVIDAIRELEAVRSDGNLFPIELTVTVVSESEGQHTYIGSIRDITLRKAQEERIRFLALNDQLTGLPNRASFNDKIEEAVARAQRTGNGLALMFIDLDKFKPINDTYGHEAGDIVLKTVGERLKMLIRDTDTAARLGGDEFVLIMENVNDRETMEQVARKLLEKVPQPIDVGSTECSVGVSIGISHFPTDGDAIPDLLHAADQAMYKVKEAGRNNFAFCD